MPDLREQLGLRFSNQCYANFGNVIRNMVVRGVRCHSATVINVRSPITAISGYNGTGKSTLLQLAAAAYQEQENPQYVKDFIVRGTLDAMPFLDDASVEFAFETTKGQDGNLVSPGNLTLSYNTERSGWDGYDRRPNRHVFFGGIGMFLPRSERQEDYFFKNPDRLHLEEAIQLSHVVRDWSAKILNCGYESVARNRLKYRTKQEEVLSTVSNGNSYSESHMGCGEGRIQSPRARPSRYDSRDSVPEVATAQRFALVRFIRGGSEVTNAPRTLLTGLTADAGLQSGEYPRGKVPNVVANSSERRLYKRTVQ